MKNLIFISFLFFFSYRVNAQEKTMFRQMDSMVSASANAWKLRKNTTTIPMDSVAHIHITDDINLNGARLYSGEVLANYLESAQPIYIYFECLQGNWIEETQQALDVVSEYIEDNASNGRHILFDCMRWKRPKEKALPIKKFTYRHPKNEVCVSNFTIPYNNIDSLTILYTKTEESPEGEIVRETGNLLGDDITIEKAQFPGGNDALFKYLADELKYPLQSQRDGLTHSVDFDFIVEKDGAVDSVIFSDLSDFANDTFYQDFYGEIERVFRNMPKWTPASKRVEGTATKEFIPTKVSATIDFCLIAPSGEYKYTYYSYYNRCLSSNSVSRFELNKNFLSYSLDRLIVVRGESLDSVKSALKDKSRGHHDATIIAKLNKMQRQSAKSWEQYRCKGEVSLDSIIKININALGSILMGASSDSLLFGGVNKIPCKEEVDSVLNLCKKSLPFISLQYDINCPNQALSIVTDVISDFYKSHQPNVVFDYSVMDCMRELNKNYYDAPSSLVKPNKYLKIIVQPEILEIVEVQPEILTIVEDQLEIKEEPIGD